MLSRMLRSALVALFSSSVLASCVPVGNVGIKFQNHSSPQGSTGGSGPSGNLPTDPTGPSDTDGGFIDPTPGHDGDDGGYLPPTDLLFCGETGQIVLKKGQSTLLTWSYPGGYVPTSPLQFTLESTPAVQSMGTITSASNVSARYVAPATIPQEFEVSVRAALGDNTTPAVCRVRLIADEDLGVPDDGTTRGLVGNVYELPVNQPYLPDFAQMTPLSTILVPNFDVPTRAFSMGFPGVPDLFEWFGIRFEGRIVVPTTGSYLLSMNSDDGSILWIGGSKVIDNDGVHAPVTVNREVVLTAGIHPLRLDYYQGPRYLIALELFWKKPGDEALAIIPPDNFLRP